MGLMDKAIADTVKSVKGFKKTNIEKVIHYCELILEKDYGRE